MQLPIANVSVVENRATFSAFPDLPDSIVLFGGGYAVGMARHGTPFHCCRSFQVALRRARKQRLPCRTMPTIAPPFETKRESNGCGSFL